MQPDSNLRTTCISLFCLLWILFTFAHQKHFDSGTPVSRLDLLYSMWEHHSFAIDPYHENTGDKAFFGGHYYSDKAPGTVALSFPAFALAQYALKSSNPTIQSRESWFLSSWITCALSLAPITALGAVAFFRWARLFVPERYALLATMALFLGAPPFPYCTMLFSHSVVVAFICIALLSLRYAVTDVQEISRPALVSAGACLGMALASEFTAGSVVIIAFAWAAYRWPRRIWCVLLGGFGPMMLVPLYSHICFGTPFTIGYSYQATIPEMRTGFWGLELPSGYVMWELLFGQMRGLFYWSPFFLCWLLWAIPLRRVTAQVLFLILPVLLQVLAISGTRRDWPAGYVHGPRLLSPMLPVMALPCILFAVRWPRLAITLASASVLLTSGATLINATPEAHFHQPLLQVHIPQLLSGDICPNLALLAGFPSHVSFGVFFWLLMFGFYFLWKSTPTRVASTCHQGS